ncbi:MAG: pentapeptide repeat-containing protein [Cyanobacteria bacterium J06638_22]
MKKVLQRIKYLLPWIGTGVVVAIVALALWLIPNWDSPNSVKDAKEKEELANANRDMALRVLQTLGGLGFIATAFLAWRNLQLTEDQQVSNRFGQAVKMLADGELEVRLGGIYLLERIAKDSREDHPVVMEVLTAFIREKKMTSPTQAASFTLVSLLPDNMSISESEPLKPISCPQDIQSALTVIGRREVKYDVRSLDLNGANLQGAWLDSANLREASLVGANLQKAWLYSANLQEASLIGTNLQEVSLYSANLREASLIGTNLQEADLHKTNLQQATLKGVNLQGATLGSANLQDIKFDSSTQWPAKEEVAKAKNIPPELM